MQIKINDVSITLTPEQCKQLCDAQSIYPKIRRGTVTGNIYKFISYNETVVLFSPDNDYDIGATYTFSALAKASFIDVPYDAVQDLWHGQPVYCWDDGSISHMRALKFYDAINKCTHRYDGLNNGSKYNNYEAIDPAHYIPWMLNAYKTLEGINNGN